jgi:hypothetical protein
MTDTGHCIQLLVEMGTCKVFIRVDLNCDPLGLSLPHSWDYRCEHHTQLQTGFLMLTFHTKWHRRAIKILLHFQFIFELLFSKHSFG